jgi:hypothetical protein
MNFCRPGAGTVPGGARLCPSCGELGARRRRSRTTPPFGLVDVRRRVLREVRDGPSAAGPMGHLDSDLREFDPYSILGVRKTASFEQARAAFRRRAQLLHPDRHRDAPDALRREAAVAMRELTAAFESIRRLSAVAADGS